MTRPLRVVIWVVLAVIVGASLPSFGQAPLAAQNPPRPPHQYYGDGSAESAARIDGMAPPEGTVIVARDTAENEVGRTTITQTHWLIQVSEEDAAAVSFEFLGCAGRTETFPVRSGDLTAVRLEADGCEPTIDPAALVATEAVAGEDSGGSATEEAPEAEIEGVEDEQAAEAAADAAAAVVPRDTASPSPTPVPVDSGGSGAWIWILVALLIVAMVGGVLYWLRRPVARAR